MVSYPFFIGNNNQQKITNSNEIVSAWCQVSPSMSLNSSPTDVFQLLSVKASLVEDSLDGEKLINPNQVSISYVNPITGIDNWEVLPYDSDRFNIQAVPINPTIYEDLKGNFILQNRPALAISGTTVSIILLLSMILSINNNRNN